MKSTLKWNELWENGFSNSRTCNRTPTHTYEVKKPSNVEWPEDTEIISWCDGGPGMNFGGRVRKIGDVAYVDVYVD